MRDFIGGFLFSCALVGGSLSIIAHTERFRQWAGAKNYPTAKDDEPR